jgi:hypothetical protein
MDPNPCIGRRRRVMKFIILRHFPIIKLPFPKNVPIPDVFGLSCLQKAWASAPIY